MKTTRIGWYHCRFHFTTLATLGTVLFLLALQPLVRADNFAINFESPPFPTNAAPNNFFTAGAMQSSGITGRYNISGGVVLGNPTFLLSFTTNNGATLNNLYGTADFASPTLLDTITLLVDSSLDAISVSGLLFNGQTISETYTVSAYSGNSLVTSQNYLVAPDTATNGFASFFVSAEGPWITSVTISSLNAGLNGWDFFVDSINVSTLNPIPEPSTLSLAGVGLALLGWRGWRNRRRNVPLRRAGPGGGSGRIGGWLVLGLLGGGSAMAAWVEQGPGPITGGQSEKIGYAGVTNPVCGGISSVAINPGDLDNVYVGTVNGGVWETFNASNVSPTWIPLTDLKLPALSITSLAMSPVDNFTLFAGTGSSSSFGYPGAPLGSRGIGVARTTDGGNTWTLLATNTFNGIVVLNIVPTALSGGNVVLAATCPNLFTYPSPDNGGIYRSTNNGTAFTRLSDNGASLLPDAGVTSLVPDPGNLSRFYAGIPGNGVYRSVDGGLTWSNTAALPAATRILLSVSKNTSAVYAMIINAGGMLQGVYRSVNSGVNWTNMGAPTLEIFPGGQGKSQGAILADPNNSNVVFIAGDRQDFGGAYGGNWSVAPNVNGCLDYSANICRGDAAQPLANTWTNVVGSGAKGSSPHADSRALVYYDIGAAGTILHAGDGGLSRLEDPNNAATNRLWVDNSGNLRPTEMHSVAYDSLNQTIISGNQDTGTSMQSAAGNFAWRGFLVGDGAVVAVDNDQAAHAGTSIRYSSYYQFGSFNRSTWNNANTQVGGFSNVLLNVTNAGSAGVLTAVDTVSFYNPFVLNAINPRRMLIGTQNIYESMDRGDTLNLLTNTFSNIGNGISEVPMSYGSRSNGVVMEDAFYVGSAAKVYHRARLGNPVIRLTTYPGGLVRGVVMDVQDYRNVYVLDENNRIWASFNEGANWTDLTLNLTNLCPDVRCLELFSPTNTPINTVLLAGGLGGIFQMRRPGGGGTLWTNLSSGLPHAMFLDMHYNYANNVLVAGSLGRGAWTLSQYFRGGGSANEPVLVPLQALPGKDANAGVATSAPSVGSPPIPPFVTQVIPPALAIQQSGANIILSWTVTAKSYVLEASSDLTQSGGWSPVPTQVIVTNGLNTVTVPMTSQTQFYRLSPE